MVVLSCIAVTKTLYHWCFFREWYRSRSLCQELKLNKPDCLCWRRHIPSIAMETRLQENRWVCQQYWEHRGTRVSGMSHVCHPFIVLVYSLVWLKLVTKPNWSSWVVATCVLRWELKPRRRRRERQTIKKRFTGFCTGHGKPEKSWNLSISFSRPGKAWNLIVGPWGSWKIKILFDRLVTADDKARTI